MTVIAFDRGGVLLHYKEMRDMARVLMESGYKVHCITAVPDTEQAHKNEEHERVIDSLTLQIGQPLHGVHFVYHATTPNPSPTDQIMIAHNAGLDKAAVMKKIGAFILFDDNPYVCKAVCGEGLFAVHVNRTWLNR